MGVIRNVSRFVGRLILAVAILLFFVIAAFITTYLYIKWPVEHPNVEMTINAGTSVRRISDRLEEEGVIKCASCFRVFITVMGYSSKLRAGDYEFESGLSASEVVGKLLRGDFKTYRVTIVEGWTIDQIADYLKTLPFVDNENFAEEFKKAVKDIKFVQSLDLDWSIPTLEGYLFPSTYEVYKLKDPKKFAFLMASEFKRKFANSIKEKSAELGLEPYEIVTLASIVEKETGKPEERPLIASVFYNRLKNGMLLQSDPTTIYGLKDFDGNLTKQDLANRHRYNTYVHPGLPPGPISNPGEASIEAVLNPAKTNYLYFVSRNDGSHVFSETLSEHNKNVYEYQVKRSPVPKPETQGGS